jgi:hypothetical protein
MLTNPLFRDFNRIYTLEFTIALLLIMCKMHQLLGLEK